MSLVGCSAREIKRDDSQRQIKMTSGNFLIKRAVLSEFGNNRIVLKGVLENNSESDIRAVIFKVTLLDDYGLAVGEPTTFDSTFVAKHTERFINIPIPDINNREKVKDYKIEVVKVLYYAKYTIELEKPLKSPNLNYSDQSIEIGFLFKESSVEFSLKNKTEDALEIDWNKISFVNTDNVSTKIFHSSIKYSDKEKSMVETIVPPESIIQDVVFPVNKVRLESNEWVSDPLLPLFYSDEDLVGKKMKIFIPMKINNRVTNYTFSFNISAVEK